MIFSDEYFMKAALREAELAFEDNEVPIGAVVVANNNIIGKGHNMTEKLNDVTAHAEMLAITAAEQYLGGKYLSDCTLYVTLEPCTMCASAMAWAQVKRLIYGASDPKKGFTQYNTAIMHPKTIVQSGVLEEECAELLLRFFKEKRR